MPSEVESCLVTCVAEAPTEDKKAEVVCEMVDICKKDGSVEDFDCESRAMWEALEEIAFPDDLNEPIDNFPLPSGLQNLTFGRNFNQAMDNVGLPDGLQNLTFELACSAALLFWCLHWACF